MLIKSDLALHFLAVFIGQGGEVQLITNRSREGNLASCAEWRDAVHLMVRHDGHVRGDAAPRMDDAGAVLDAQARDSVGVIARPNLWHVDDQSISLGLSLHDAVIPVPQVHYTRTNGGLKDLQRGRPKIGVLKDGILERQRIEAVLAGRTGGIRTEWAIPEIEDGCDILRG